MDSGGNDCIVRQVDVQANFARHEQVREIRERSHEREQLSGGVRDGEAPGDPDDAAADEGCRAVGSLVRVAAKSDHRQVCSFGDLAASEAVCSDARLRP